MLKNLYLYSQLFVHCYVVFNTVIIAGQFIVLSFIFLNFFIV